MSQQTQSNTQSHFHQSVSISTISSRLLYLFRAPLYKHFDLWRTKELLNLVKHPSYVRKTWLMCIFFLNE